MIHVQKIDCQTTNPKRRAAHATVWNFWLYPPCPAMLGWLCLEDWFFSGDTGRFVSGRPSVPFVVRWWLVVDKFWYPLYIYPIVVQLLPCYQKTDATKSVNNTSTIDKYPKRRSTRGLSTVRSTSDHAGQGVCLPPLLQGGDTTWPSEGLLVHRRMYSLTFLFPLKDVQNNRPCSQATHGFWRKIVCGEEQPMFANHIFGIIL